MAIDTKFLTQVITEFRALQTKDAVSPSTFIKQTTTERAGAMRTQQVVVLNAAKKGVSDLQTQVANINALISELQAALGGTSAGAVCNAKANISVVIENGTVRVPGINDAPSVILRCI